MLYALATAIAIAHWMLRRLDIYGWQWRTANVSPDGHAYLAMARGERGEGNYRRRWLLPWLLGPSPRRWYVFSAICQVATAPALLWYLDGFPPTTRLVGVCLYVGLSGVFRTNVLYPVLVDPAGILCMVLEAAAIQHHIWWLAVPLLVVSGAIRETVPVFAALAAGSFWPLLGLVPVAMHAIAKRGGPRRPYDFNIVGLAHQNHWFDPVVMFLPWGVCLAAAFAPGWWLLAAVSLAYAQLLIATDSPRLYQWCFPVVISAALTVLPQAWYVPLVLVHWFQPWQSDAI